jgi:hypothetical protein
MCGDQLGSNESIGRFLERHCVAITRHLGEIYISPSESMYFKKILQTRQYPEICMNLRPLGFY